MQMQMQIILPLEMMIFDAQAIVTRERINLTSLFKVYKNRTEPYRIFPQFQPVFR
jgi:hypothetical protein